MNSNEESKNILTEEQKNALLSVLMNACRNQGCDNESSNESCPDPSNAIDTEFDSDEESDKSNESCDEELTVLLKLLDAHDKVCKATLTYLTSKRS